MFGDMKGMGDLMKQAQSMQENMQKPQQLMMRCVKLRSRIKIKWVIWPRVLIYLPVLRCHFSDQLGARRLMPNAI